MIFFFTVAPTGTNSPFKLFKQILVHNDMFVNGMFVPIPGTRNLSVNLFNRDFRIGFLFSPSPQGAINQNNVPEYVNYRQINPGATYSQFVMVQYTTNLGFTPPTCSLQKFTITACNSTNNQNVHMIEFRDHAIITKFESIFLLKQCKNFTPSA